MPRNDVTSTIIYHAAAVDIIGFLVIAMLTVLPMVGSGLDANFAMADLEMVTWQCILALTPPPPRGRA